MPEGLFLDRPSGIAVHGRQKNGLYTRNQFEKGIDNTHKQTFLFIALFQKEYL